MSLRTFRAEYPGECVDLPASRRDDGYECGARKENFLWPKKL